MKPNYGNEGNRHKPAVTLAKISLPATHNLPCSIDLRTPKDATPEERVLYSRVRLGAYNQHRLASAKPGRASPVDVPLVNMPKTRPVAKKRGTPVGQPLPERLARAAEVAVEAETFKDGRMAGQPRCRVLGELETLRNRGALDVEQYWASQRFQRSVAMTVMAEGNLISNYEPSFIDNGSQRGMMAVEKAVHHITDLKNVYRLVPRAHHSILNWMKRNVLQDEPLDQAANYIFASGKYAKASRNREVRRKKFLAMLRKTLDLLNNVYVNNTVDNAWAA